MSPSIKSAFFYLFALLFALPGHAQDAVSSAAQRAADEHILHEFFAKKNISPAKGNGIYYTVTKEGAGHRILAGETVTVSYTGRFLDGTVFDSNTDTTFHHTEPYKFVLGTRSVIRGWDKGIQLLKPGTAATFYIPSSMAYGADGQPNIPPNTILVFDIEVLTAIK